MIQKEYLVIQKTSFKTLLDSIVRNLIHVNKFTFNPSSEFKDDYYALNEFKKIIFSFKSLTEQNKQKFTFVYLPSIERYLNNDNNPNYYKEIMNFLRK